MDNRQGRDEGRGEKAGQNHHTTCAAGSRAACTCHSSSDEEEILLPCWDLTSALLSSSSHTTQRQTGRDEPFSQEATGIILIGSKHKPEAQSHASKLGQKNQGGTRNLDLKLLYPHIIAPRCRRCSTFKAGKPYPNHLPDVPQLF